MTLHTELAEAIFAFMKAKGTAGHAWSREAVVDLLGEALVESVPELVTKHPPGVFRRMCQDAVYEENNRIMIHVVNLALWLDAKRAAPEVAHLVAEQLVRSVDSSGESN